MEDGQEVEENTVNEKPQLCYQATFLFTHCFIREATENHTGKVSDPKPLSRLYATPAHTAAKPTSISLCLNFEALFMVFALPRVPPPTFPVKLLPILQGPAQVPLYMKPSSIPTVNDPTVPDITKYPWGRNHSWLKTTAFQVSSIDRPNATSTTTVSSFSTFPLIVPALHGGLANYCYPIWLFSCI